MNLRSLKLLPGAFIFSIIIQNVLAQKTQIGFEYLTTNDGLSSNYVRCTFKDHDGLMWFGTDKGLNKYNGRTVEKFNAISEDSTSLLDDKIVSVSEDHLDQLWIGSALGLNKFNRKKDHFKGFPLPTEKSVESNEFIGMFEDESHVLFVVSESGLYAFNEKTGYQKLVDTRQVPAFTHVSCFAYHNGSLYLGTWTGYLFKYSIKTKIMEEVSLETIEGFTGQSFYTLYSDNHSLLVSIIGKGVYAYTYNSTDTFKQLIAATAHEPADKVISIKKDNMLNYWLATEHGIVIVNSNFEILHHFINTFQNTSINNNYCASIYLDNTNIVWIGTRFGGVNKYDPNKIKFPDSFEIINTSSLEKNRAVKCFYQDRKGIIWIGGDFGLSKFSAQHQHIKTWSLENLYDVKSGVGAIASILENEDGKLWLGNWGNGLSLFDPAQNTNIQYTSYLKSKSGNGKCIMNLHAQGDYLFLFTFDGMAQFNVRTKGITWHQNDPFDSLTLSNNSITSYSIDSDSNLWIGTPSGLNYFHIKTGKTKRYFHERENENTIASNSIYSLLKDHKGNIWIGTSNGLSLINARQQKIEKNVFQEAKSQKIYTLQEDANHSIWASNGTGLFKFDLETKNTKAYNENDGVKKMLEYSYKGLDGSLFFGGVNGVTSFNPEKIIDNQYIPRIVISKFKLFNTVITNKTGHILKDEVAYTDVIHLKHNQSSFSFEYSALNYTVPEKNKFKYILKGFDADWTYTGINEQANYTNVPPGDYTFIVLGSNNDGIWNTDGAKLKILINPPWYWNSWTKILHIFLILFFMFVVYRFLLYRQKLSHDLELERIERHQEEEKFQERFNFFTNVSHQIRTPLTLISGSVEQITDELKNNSVVLKRLETVNRNTLTLLNLVNQLIDFKRFETEKSPQLSKVDIVETLKELQLNYSDIAQTKKIELILDTSIDLLNVYIDKDKLDKILNNLIHNALKFTAQNGKVTIKLKTSNDTLKIDITDTGIGIAKEDMPNLFRRFWRAKQQKEEVGGIGLAYTKDLIATMKGIISVDSSIGKGTTFSIEIPEALIIPEAEEQPIQFEPDEQPIIENGKSKVLIVEDNDEMRHFIRETLELEFSVDSEKDALAGLNALKRFTPDIIISDVMMTGMDGITFCKEIKSNILTSHIPVILLTANVLEESIISGYDSGADDYITKPFSNKILLKRVENLIESRNILRKKYVKDMFPDLKELTSSKPDEAFLKNAMKIVEENYGDSDFDAIKFSQEMAVSRTLLYTKLKSITGQSVNEFIRTIRLKKAAWLLTNSHKQITDIAFTVGFSNAAYFTKCFTDQFGVSPRKYAEQNRNV